MSTPAQFTRGVYPTMARAVLILFTFIRSDVKTILVPTVAFGTVAAGSYSAAAVLTRVFWVGLLLLQFCVSNQSADPEEDRKNKPWRPIPAGLISLSAARRLRWALPLACILLSTRLGAVGPGITLVLATLAHDELHLGSNWILRNALNAIGYVAFNAGAARVGYPGSPIVQGARQPSVDVHILNAIAIFTTIQMQDFKDVDGDRAVGRRTLPIAYPVGSRVLTSALVPLWSLFVTRAWGAPSALSAAIVTLGIYIGYRVVLCRTKESDRWTYVWYNVWLCFLQISPFSAMGSGATRRRALYPLPPSPGWFEPAKSM